MSSVSARDNLEAALASNRQTSYAHMRKNLPMSMMLALAYESIGVVYGDIGTSPLYTYSIVFGSGLNNQDDLVGALSLIIWTLSLSTLFKYCWIVLWCDDNGEGGTFAVYGLLSRHVNLQQQRGNVKDNHNLSQYTLENEVAKSPIATGVKNYLENNEWVKYAILTLVLTGTCLVIGDGVLTPAQSVLSAIGGIVNPDPGLSQNVVVGVSIGILALLFIFQKYGSAAIGFTFAPIVILFLTINTVVGIWNLARYDAWFMFKAFSPHYGILFLTRNGKQGWIQLGGIFLCITGSEALFADLGHFSAKSISLAFTVFVYPSLLLTYIGQAAWLTNLDNAANVGQTYYLSIPQTRGLYWPIFVVATAAAAVASQAMISATFSIINQSMALGCFPRVKVMHTSSKVKGQIYIPEINYLLAALTLIVTGVMGQNGTTTIANAYGVAVSGVMIITTIMVTLVLICVKQKPVYYWLPFFSFFFFFDGVYLSSNLYKVPQGGWVPLAFAGTFLTVMSVWRYGTNKKYQHDLEHKLSLDWVTTTLANDKMARVPGVGLFYSNLMSGVPAIFSHFLANVPALHEVVLFVAVKHVEVPHVVPEERCLFRRLGPLKARMYRCVLRYGYNDVTREQARTMTDQLMEALALYIRTEDPASWTVDGQPVAEHAQRLLTENGEPLGYDSPECKSLKEAEVQQLQRAQQSAVIHIIGRSYMRAANGATAQALFNKLVIDYLYFFLKVNTRDAANTLAIPQENLLEVGMVVKV